jgi:hypothetical protein
MCVSICNFFSFVVIIHFWGSLPLTLLKSIPSMELSKSVFIYNLEEASCDQLNYL